MNKIRITFFLLFALLISTTSNAQLLRSTSKVGTTAAQFLKIGAGARAIGMGGAYSALGGDIYSIYWNPAGLASINSNTEIAFNHAEWLADISYDFAAAALNLGDFGVLSASFTSLSVPEEDVTTFAAPEGDGRTWDASMLAISIGYSKMLTDRFSFGAQLKFIRETIWNSGASGFAVDIGTQYVTPFNDLVIGASISNFGSTMSLDGRDIQFNYDPNDNLDTGPNNVPANLDTDEFDLPLTFRIGLSMDLYESRFFRVTGAVDATHPNDNTEYMNSGLELAYDEMFFVRAGYKSLFKENSEEGLTYGAGFKYTLSSGMNLYINYGYADYGRLENVQFVDVGIGF
jgi:opacity protein-like surface antigen